MKRSKKYFADNGYTEASAIKFFKYYDPDWKDSKDRSVIRWKQKAQGIWFKPENELIHSTDNADRRVFGNVTSSDIKEQMEYMKKLDDEQRLGK